MSNDKDIEFSKKNNGNIQIKINKSTKQKLNKLTDSTNFITEKKPDKKIPEEKIDYEKVFIEEFKKMMLAGIIVRKINKRFGYKYVVAKLQENLRNLELFQIEKPEKKKIIELEKIIQINIFETKKVHISTNELKINLELENDTIANILFDGIKLLNKINLSNKKILRHILNNIESDSESESELETKSVSSLNVNLEK
jgi:hypothetical protein